MVRYNFILLWREAAATWSLVVREAEGEEGQAASTDSTVDLGDA